MSPTITNTDIPGDTTPQPNYMQLNPRARDLVDRAIYAKIIQRSADHYDFTDAEKQKITAQTIFAPAGNKAVPRSDLVEQDIERMRESYSIKLLKHDAAAFDELSTASRNAPGAAEARRALNAIIRFNGDECGCSLNAPAMTSDALTSIINNSRPGRHGR